MSCLSPEKSLIFAALDNMFFTDMDIDKLYFVFIAFVLSMIAGWITIPQIVVISKRKRLFDEINERKIHTAAVSRLGGLSFFPSAMFAFTLCLGLRYYNNIGLDVLSESVLLTDMLFMMAAMFIIFMIGLADDLVGVGYKYKFVVQIMAGLLLVLAGMDFDNLGGLFMLHELPWWISAVFTVLFTVFILNAFNLIDGVDGLCSGIGSFILIVLGTWFVLSGYYVYAMFASAMLGVVVMFFRYNFFGERLKVFMGDTGSLTLGFMVIFLSFKLLQCNSSAQTMAHGVQLNSPLTLVLGLLFVPAFDVLRVFANRINNGKSPFHPDKTHLHHKLLASGLTHRQCTFSVLLLVICFSAINFILSEVAGLNINYIIIVDLLWAITINHILNLRIKHKKA